MDTTSIFIPASRESDRPAPETAPVVYADSESTQVRCAFGMNSSAAQNWFRCPKTKVRSPKSEVQSPKSCRNQLRQRVAQPVSCQNHLRQRVAQPVSCQNPAKSE